MQDVLALVVLIVLCSAIEHPAKVGAWWAKVETAYHKAIQEKTNG